MRNTVCRYLYIQPVKITTISDSGNMPNTTTCFGPLFGSSSGCPWNSQSIYTLGVVVFGGRDLVLHREVYTGCQHLYQICDMSCEVHGNHKSDINVDSLYKPHDVKRDLVPHKHHHT
jgi:hypothetical protein